jgi:hypothetical protein
LQLSIFLNPACSLHFCISTASLSDVALNF